MPQVFKYVRDKAVQIDVTSGDAAAYINQDGRYAVIIQNATRGPHKVIGLPAGSALKIGEAQSGDVKKRNREGI